MKRLARPKVLGITLARGGSKGIPGKNIRDLAGKPLLEYTVHAAKASSRLTDYVVSTDSEKIRHLAIELGAECPFLRPAELATDTATSASALVHAVNWMEEHNDLVYDFVVELMVTNPLKRATDIDGCIELLMNSGADSAIAVHEVGDGHPARLKKIVDGKLADFCVPEPLEARRQDLTPKAYIRSGAIYAMRRDELIVHGRRYGSEFSLPYVLPAARAVNIDSPMDWLLAEHIVSNEQVTKQVS